jgi:copper chaperone CopZ
MFSFNTKQMTAGIFEKNMNKGGSNDTITVSFKVNGTAACESNIEAALTSQAGVISANWNSSDKQITVIFKTAQIKTSDLHSFLAMAGYDTSELRAKQNIYDALPASCKYTREAETE